MINFDLLRIISLCPDPKAQCYFRLTSSELRIEWEYKTKSGESMREGLAFRLGKDFNQDEADLLIAQAEHEMTMAYNNIGAGLS